MQGDLCNSGYYVSSGSCTPCNILNCFSCVFDTSESKALCQKCNSGYELDVGTNTCKTKDTAVSNNLAFCSYQAIASISWINTVSVFMSMVEAGCRTAAKNRRTGEHEVLPVLHERLFLQNRRYD